MYIFERERASVKRECVRAWERENMCLSVCVYVFKRENICLSACVSVCVSESVCE